MDSTKSPKINQIVSLESVDIAGSVLRSLRSSQNSRRYNEIDYKNRAIITAQVLNDTIIKEKVNNQLSKEQEKLMTKAIEDYIPIKIPPTNTNNISNSKFDSDDDSDLEGNNQRNVCEHSLQLGNRLLQGSIRPNRIQQISNHEGSLKNNRKCDDDDDDLEDIDDDREELKELFRDFVPPTRKTLAGFDRKAGVNHASAGNMESDDSMSVRTINSLGTKFSTSQLSTEYNSSFIDDSRKKGVTIKPGQAIRVKPLGNKRKKQTDFT